MSSEYAQVSPVSVLIVSWILQKLKSWNVKVGPDAGEISMYFCDVLQPIGRELGFPA